MTSEPIDQAAGGPTGLRARALGPDLTRGFMLLFIALANSHYFLRSPSVLGGFPQDGSAVDNAVVLLIAAFVDGRAFPLFGLLFGYGVAQIARRQAETGRDPRAVRRLLWRRSLFLIVAGFVDGLLFYVGDILAAYGVLLFAGVWALRWRDRTLIVVAILFLLLTSIPGDGSMTISADGPDATMLPPDLLAGVADRILFYPFIAFLGPIGFCCPFLIGLWAGRRRILERPAQHIRLLTWTAVLGIAASVAGGLPIALVLAGVVGKPSQDVLHLLGPLHDSSGVLGGFGYAALISMIALRIGRDHGLVAEAVAAVGQRSLTCYLIQSVVWVVAFTPYLADLSGELTITTTALLAGVTWLGTVGLAYWMHLRSYRGPMELLVRRVTYGRSAAAISAV
ncbi:DUF418 domain-containing protein [Kribbella sp. CA-293567]|uniref:DUF418 domain-containing protein n=1 Tax=Kribbella sp. CA-293567 TaxID=3002436 RepID=UPI0022DDD118|nr:DUF418 domain-containing protein [Kribbella sp. CA-293567]WBQ02832.1 DUF418 domain-containing protein [Kribbella sp. CA-293567]